LLEKNRNFWKAYKADSNKAVTRRPL